MLPGHDAGQLALGGPALAGGLDQLPSRELFHSETLCDSVGGTNKGDTGMWDIDLWVTNS